MKNVIILVQISLLISMNMFAQNPHQGKKNRKPAVAGKFYPARKQALENNLKSLFENAKTQTIQNLAALIAPHAGYIFSGEVAAAVYNQLNPDRNYQNIFILASSHRAFYKGASIYNRGNYETPLGEVKVNTSLADKLIRENKCFTFHSGAHGDEHSIEVQLPFLQYRLKKELQIVPIVIGSQDMEECVELAKALKPYFNPNNLFVVSTDFSHYPDYETANEMDQQTADAIISNRPEKLLETINQNSRKNIRNLHTSLCGMSAVLSLMNITRDLQGVRYHPVLYRNSGDAGVADKSQVVGYYGITVSRTDEAKEEGYYLNEEDKRQLLHIARQTLISIVKREELPTYDPKQYPEALTTNCGAFVSLHKKGDLRGCIGQFDATKPLYMVVREMAVSAATKDGRFLPVSPDELEELEIEISVLTPLKPIKEIDEFELGKHGIFIRNGLRTGTFLPQVAESTGWSVEEFLGHCSRDKAGMEWDSWKESELYTYEAIIFKESDFE